MGEIVLSAEQSRLIADADGPVTVRTASGEVVGIIEPVVAPDLEIEEIQARCDRTHEELTIDEVLSIVTSDGISIL